MNIYIGCVKYFPGRILCLAWHSMENVIITGGIDNLRVWSQSSGHAIQRLTLARIERQKETIVWAVTVTRWVGHHHWVTSCIVDGRVMAGLCIVCNLQHWRICKQVNNYNVKCTYFYIITELGYRYQSNLQLC